MDYDAYTRPEVFVLETMGRDAGWLAASTCLTGDVDLLVLPEVDFRRSIFLEQVRAKMEQQGSCYVVVSEGARWYDGTYLSANGKAADGLGHAMLGGAAGRLKSMIVEAGIVPRCVVQDLSRVARSSNFAMSLVDLEESYDLGVSAHMRSAKPEFTGQVVGIRRGRGVDVDGDAIAGAQDHDSARVRQRAREGRTQIVRAGEPGDVIEGGVAVVRGEHMNSHNASI